jgi:RNA polymerase sigma-70 factor (ECF subfamily)
VITPAAMAVAFGSAGAFEAPKFLLRVIDSFGRLLRSMSRQDDDPNRGAPEDVGPRLAGGRTLADLSQFVLDNHDRLIRLAGLVCRNVADAEDAVQAALERGWRNQAGLRDQERLKPWIDRIVVREAIRITRSRESLLARILGRDGDEIVVEPVDRRAPDATLMTELKHAYARLSAEQRAVVALHLYAGYSVAETAEIVGAPAETVRSRLRLARRRLRIELEDA